MGYFSASWCRATQLLMIIALLAGDLLAGVASASDFEGSSDHPLPALRMCRY